jgi:hypothetical protein
MMSHDLSRGINSPAVRAALRLIGQRPFLQNLAQPGKRKRIPPNQKSPMISSDRSSFR